MQNKGIYEFAVIRLVPKVEREEFLNIGVILFSKHQKFLDLKYQINESRINCFSEEIDLQTIHEYLGAWTLICKGEANAGPIGQLELASRYRWLTASKDTIIQCSKSHPGLSDDPGKVLLDIFERYVE